MPKVKFNGKPAFDSNSMWGYTVEVTEAGVFGEVPEELLETEIGAGRVQLVEAAKKVEAPKPVEVAEDKPQSAQDVVENGSGKRGPGRPKAE